MKMKEVFIILIPSVLVGYLAVIISYPNDPDVGLNVMDLITRYEYPVETHDITTKDGYILTVYRIPHGKNKIKRDKKGGPVLLNPSLLSSSADFVNMGPDVSLGFILADRGYDVWLLNPRGTTWSRRHKWLNLDLNADYQRFWDFSFAEIGYYDIPATIDYILSKTKTKDIQFVGYSQGVTSFFVMASKLPEYQKKVRLLTAIAPSVALEGLSSIPAKYLFYSIDHLKKILGLFNSLEFLPHYVIFKIIPRILCKDGSIVQGLCAGVIDAIGGLNFPNKTRIPVITSNTPAGASVKQIQHFAQLYFRGKYSEFDYGETENILKYGQPQPPDYNLNAINLPVFLVYGEKDIIVKPKAAERVIKLLPNVTSIFQVEGYNHVDFIYAHNTKARVFDKLITVMQTYD